MDNLLGGESKNLQKEIELVKSSTALVEGISKRVRPTITEEAIPFKPKVKGNLRPAKEGDKRVEKGDEMDKGWMDKCSKSPVKKAISELNKSMELIKSMSEELEKGTEGTKIGAKKRSEINIKPGQSAHMKFVGNRRRGEGVPHGDHQDSSEG